jgi:integrase
MRTSITLREAFDAHYDKSELRQRTVQKYGHGLNAWERHTPNPPVDVINDEAAEAFRSACLEIDHSPATINSRWGDIRAMLNRLGPRVHGNPRGLGLIEQVAYMRPVKAKWKRPTRVKLNDLTAIYIAAKTMKIPFRLSGINPPDWWRTLIVLGYATGLRRGDLFAIEWSHINWDDRSLAVDPGKTGKADWLPLSEYAISHLERVKRPTPFVFEGGMGFQRSTKRFSDLWKGLLKAGGVDSHFTLQDIRRTAASEAERVERGAGAILLQHRGRSVTQRFYLSSVEELRDVVDKMRVPIGFKAGPGMSQRADKKVSDDAHKMHLKPHDFETELGTDPGLWRFTEIGFVYRGRAYRLRGVALRLLRRLVRAGRTPLTNSTIRRSFGQSWSDPMHQAAVEVARLGGRLRTLLGLGNFDPLPLIDRGTEGSWLIHLPAWLNAD